MNFKSALKYQLYGMRRPLIVFYIVIYSLIILIAIMRAVLDRNNVNALTSGLEMASIIFILSPGLILLGLLFICSLPTGSQDKLCLKALQRRSCLWQQGWRCSIASIVKYCHRLLITGLCIL